MNNSTKKQKTERQVQNTETPEALQLAIDTLRKSLMDLGIPFDEAMKYVKNQLNPE